MKQIAYLGTTLVAVIGLAAIFGVPGLASANEIVLCKAKEAPCAAANIHPEQTIINASLESPQQWTIYPKGGFVESISCQNSSIEGQTKISQSAQGSPLEGQFQTVSWTNCVEENGNSCTLQAIQLKWQGLIAEENSAIQAATFGIKEHSSPNNGSPAMEMTCFGVTCTYGLRTGETGNISVKTGANATIAVNLQAFEKVPKLLCPSESVWEAEYHIAAPNPLWITHK